VKAINQQFMKFVCNLLGRALKIIARPWLYRRAKRPKQHFRVRWDMETMQVTIDDTAKGRLLGRFKKAPRLLPCISDVIGGMFVHAIDGNRVLQNGPCSLRQRLTDRKGVAIVAIHPIITTACLHAYTP
jgi:hypothetical protein